MSAVDPVLRYQGMHLILLKLLDHPRSAMYTLLILLILLKRLTVR